MLPQSLSEAQRKVWQAKAAASGETEKHTENAPTDALTPPSIDSVVETSAMNAAEKEKKMKEKECRDVAPIVASTKVSAHVLPAVSEISAKQGRKLEKLEKKERKEKRKRQEAAAAANAGIATVALTQSEKKKNTHKKKTTHDNMESKPISQSVDFDCVD